MARFFFDIRLGECEAIDDVGIELDSADIARIQGEAALPGIANEAPRTSVPETLVLTVRDENGISIYQGETVTHSRSRVRA